MDPALPHKAVAHDALRCGLAALKEDAAHGHPVEAIQACTPLPGGPQRNPQMLADLYGLAFPAKLDIERQLLSKFGRLPGVLHSSRLGLESLTGASLLVSLLWWWCWHGGLWLLQDSRPCR
jgi:proteasome maturation protein